MTFRSTRAWSPPWRSPWRYLASWPSPPGCPWSEACPRPKPNWPGRNLLADACAAHGDEDPERDETGHASPKVTHRGSVQGSSPGCLSEYQSPEHSEFGSSGGP